MSLREVERMVLKRTQVYLEPGQHRSLKREAEEKGISLAELLRQIVRDYLRKEHLQEDFFKIVGLGKSGRSDVAKEHDHYLAEAISRDEDLC
jgi:hypothetical protein